MDVKIEISPILYHSMLSGFGIFKENWANLGKMGIVGQSENYPEK